MNDNEKHGLMPFQTSYPIDLAEEFFERYYDEPWIDMPGTYQTALHELRVKRWHEEVARPQYEEAIAAYQSAMDRFAEERRAWREQKARDEVALSQYERDLRAWEAQIASRQHDKAKIISLMAKAKTKEEKAALRAELTAEPPTPQHPGKLAGYEPYPPRKPEYATCPFQAPTPQEPSIDNQGVLRGAKVATLEEVRRLASYQLFSGGIEQPHFYFGAIPHGFRTSGASSMLIMGGSGSGKTATIRGLMSELMPLPESERSCYRCHEKLGNPGTVSIHFDREGRAITRRDNILQHWSRSFTHQAVVYNAKNEYLSILCSLGFGDDEDIFLLDPADARCYAWDIASDVNDPDSVENFAALLIPEPKEAHLKFFSDKARRLLRAVITSFRNSAKAQGREPNWNFRDLVLAFRTKQTLRDALKFDDDREATLASVLDVSAGQSDGAFGTVTQFIEIYRTVAARWHQAENRVG